MPLRKTLLAGLALWLASLTSVQAQTATLATLDQALGAQEWAQADAIAAQLDAEAGQGDVMAAYAASVRHAMEGQCADAVILADLVIEAVPFFVPPYLVSYRCHMALGRADVAGARLAAVQAILPEGPEREAVGQLLQSVRAADRPVFGGYVTVAPSSNVNRQTAETTIDGGFWGPGTIPEDARGQRGILYTLGGSMAVQLASTEALTVTGVLRTDIRFSTADEIFEPSFTAELPVSFGVWDSAQAVVAPYATLGLSDGAHARTELGLRTTLSLPLSAQNRLALDLRAAAIDRPVAPERSGYVLDGAVSLSSVLAPNLNLTTTGRAVYLHTEDETLRTLEATAKARLDMLVGDGLLLGVEGLVGQRWHWRPAPFEIESDQVDRFVTGRIDASHRDIAFGPFMPSVYYEYTRSWSDNVFYSYDSHDVGVTLRASF